MPIQIVFITDEKYVMPTTVAITSILENKKKSTSYHFYILGNTLSSTSKSIINKLKTDDTEITIIDSAKELNFKSGANAHVSKTACLKFYLPEILENLDKVLYLDSDIIVQKDLTDLYETNICDYYLASCLDALATSVSYDNRYFNSGVMLLNLEKMRKDNIPNKLIEYKLTKNNTFMDQDAFNNVCKTSIKILPSRYNFLIMLMNRNKKHIDVNFFDKDFDKNTKKIYKKCSIIHYAYKYKPWEYNLKDITKIFLKYYNKSPYKKYKLNLRNINKFEILLKILLG